MYNTEISYSTNIIHLHHKEKNSTILNISWVEMKTN